MSKCKYIGTDHCPECPYSPKNEWSAEKCHDRGTQLSRLGLTFNDPPRDDLPL